MPAAKLPRRTILLLPLALAACGGGEPKSYPPLRYGYLEPIRLNVAAIRIDDQFEPAGVAPDVSDRAPENPATVLADMGRDRLKALGSAGEAVFVIKDASLIRKGDTLSGSFWVELNIYASANVRAGYAEARVARSDTGGDGSVPDRLYRLEKQLMNRMNVELEYQVRRSLRDWLVSANAAPAPVSQQTLPPNGLPGAPGTLPPVPGAPMAPPLLRNPAHMLVPPPPPVVR